MLSQIHKEILQLLRQGKDVGSYDKERSQRVYFDSADQKFKFWVDEWGVGESTQVLHTEEDVLRAITSVRGWAHNTEDEMWTAILDFLKRY